MSSDCPLDRPVLRSTDVSGELLDDDALADLVGRYWSALDDEIRSAESAYCSTTPIPCVPSVSRMT